MKASGVVLVVLVLLGAAPVLTQRPTEKTAETGIIRGTITSAATGKPLRRARVTITPVSERGGSRLSANTNASGRFELRDVPPGSYYLAASRPGFLNLEYGQRHALERGLTISVPAGGGAVDRIDLPLPSGGVLAGRVVDDLGEPYPGVQITAVVMRYDAGTRKAYPQGGSTTDDLGRFRVSGLPPGEYSLVAISNETWRADDKRTWGYASTYFPPPSGDTAEMVRLGPSEQRTEIVIPLTAGPTARIRGRVQRENGDAVPNANVPLMYSFGTFVLTTGARTIRADASGAFEFSDVPAGHYSIGGGQGLRITVAGADLGDVAIVTRTGSTIIGSVVTDEGVPPPFPVSGIRILMEAPFGNVLPTVRIVQVETDWSFKLGSLGGKFLFRVMGLPNDWTLAAVRLDDKDISDVPYDVPTGGREIRGMRVVLTRKIGRVTGSVVDDQARPATGSTVVVFSEDAEHWVPYSRYVKAARPSPDGQFSIVGLPPGTYRALARDVIEHGQWEDRAWLEAVRDEGVRFVLVDGATETVRLHVVR